VGHRKAGAIQSGPGAVGGEPWESPRLDAALTGRLPCAFCGYELKGLSIRGICPECGTAVRATILYQVDPQADELQPLFVPRIVSFSLVLWSLGGILLMLACWTPRAADLYAAFFLYRPATDLAAVVALIAAILSGLGLIGLIKPSHETPLARSLGVLIAMLAYAPLMWAMWVIHTRIDPLNPAPYFGAGWTPGGQRTLLRLIVDASAVTLLVGVRPVARELVRRSLALRTGRVDRQTIFAMVGALLLSAIGDLLQLAVALTPENSPASGYLELSGALFIALGSALLSLGLIGGFIDSWRIGRAILTPAPSLRQIVNDSHPHSPT